MLPDVVVDKWGYVNVDSWLDFHLLLNLNRNKTARKKMCCLLRKNFSRYFNVIQKRMFVQDSLYKLYSLESDDIEGEPGEYWNNFCFHVRNVFFFLIFQEMNFVKLIGNVAKDPELLPSGKLGFKLLQKIRNVHGEEVMYIWYILK